MDRWWKKVLVRGTSDVLHAVVKKANWWSLTVYLPPVLCFLGTGNQYVGFSDAALLA